LESEEKMDITEAALKQIIVSGWTWNEQEKVASVGKKKGKIDLLKPLRNWIDKMEIKTAKKAHRICKLIPAQCPFARKIQIFGRTLITIPPLCKINPVYDELMMLRFRAISYLAEEWGEDVSKYC